MSKSAWKPIFKNIKLINSISLLKNKNIIIKTFVRNLEITKDLIGLTFAVYNGCTFRTIEIKSQMIGHKLGEFVPTRKKPIFIKKKKKKR